MEVGQEAAPEGVYLLGVREGQVGMAGKTPKNFSTKAGYQKWLAFGHMHGDFAASPGNTPVKIDGKAHKVAHVKKSK
ncbi:MAG: hypothetical protein QG671_3494 [Actinomycetota bacterium]|nr:hypothetical protein [Actinomycetota bacterium]